MPLASKGQRVVNLIVDATTIVLLQITVAVVLGMFLDEDALQGTRAGRALTIAIYSLGFVYYLGMEATLGRTVGKFVTRTRVVDSVGHKPTTSAIFMRTLCRLVPFEFVSFLLTENGLHDAASSTRVVRVERRRVEE
ncbi:MAG: RDD family protein [Planctomycetota bacterium]|nr:RDD family protein [Planctomycetota bacterium]